MSNEHREARHLNRSSGHILALSVLDCIVHRHSRKTEDADTVEVWYVTRHSGQPCDRQRVIAMPFKIPIFGRLAVNFRPARRCQLPRVRPVGPSTCMIYRLCHTSKSRAPLASNSACTADAR